MNKTPNMTEEPAPEVETMHSSKETCWWEEANAHLDLEAIARMKPKSDEEQFIGNEYFIG